MSALSRKVLLLWFLDGISLRLMSSALIIGLFRSRMFRSRIAPKVLTSSVFFLNFFVKVHHFYAYRITCQSVFLSRTMKTEKKRLV
ncbi:hypothetical protein L596_027698 [Steinernema carpocapsae]|uniref:Uncharacterized protein n=1 Tax=Steinernema carpocapsae TaxID=34508 RepID=A0A4U5LWA6_STECR|nr:hypothetical protein L596_027698 [Steinernema carpocapsae]